MSSVMANKLIFDAQLIDERDYWIARLSEQLDNSNLPLDFVRAIDDSLPREAVTWRISGETHRSLNELTGGAPFLIYVSLMSAVKICLHNYTRSQSIVVGSPAFRNGEHSNGSANCVAIVDDVDDSCSFKELLARSRETLLEAYARQTYPFFRLAKDLKIENGDNKCPFFDIAIALQDIHGDLPALNNDITMLFSRGADEITGSIEFNPRLFRRESIVRFAAQLEQLLSTLLKNPATPIGQLEMLTPQERQQVVDWNQTKTDYQSDDCIHTLFERQVEQTPDAIAVMHEDQQLTYRQLNMRANQLAHHLIGLGVRPGTLVGICTERSLEMVVGLIGILKAGGAYVPLDQTYPKERLALMMEDAEIRILVTQQAVRSQVQFPAADAALRLVCLDRDWETIAEKSRHNPQGGASPICPAYVIYTSGSTGKPKGVVIAHRALMNFTVGACSGYEIDHRDRVLQFAPIIFDTSAEEMFPCLLSGATLVLRTNAMLQSVAEFMQQCQQWGITVLDLPTAYWHWIASQSDASNWQVPDSLRFVIIGGERAIPERLAAWHERFGHGVRLVNTYGPTETTVVATTWESKESAELDVLVREVPIGRPVQNVQTYVLDDQLRLVANGVPGQLHIAGDGLAQGYLNRPELTAISFIPNPLGSKQRGERLYRTGDLVRYLPDGNLEFLGRVDHQVKVRGHRIEMGEIETVLSQHAAVQEVVVDAREYEPGDTRLVAYVVATAEEKDLATGQLLSFLHERLPVYMVPSAFVMLDKLPLTASGKVDRRALPIPDDARPDLARAYVAPRNATEEILAEAYARILGVERVGIYDNFFDLGGHSLLATQVVAKLRQAFQVELSLAQLFESPTIAGLSENIQSLREKAGQGPIAPVLKPVARDQESPLSLVQEEVSSSLVPIHKGGDCPPFFCVHAAIGSTTCFVDLARHLGSDQPFYGLQSKGLVEGQRPLKTTEEMAAHYIAAIRTVRPKGPYQLGGWSIGGVIAFEMARQLLAQGEEISLLALLDSYAPRSRGKQDDIAELINFSRHLGLPTDEQAPRREHLAPLTPDERLDCILQRALHADAVPADCQLSDVRRLFHVYQSNIEATGVYVPMHYPGKLTLFRASAGIRNRLRISALGWRKLSAGGVAIHVVPGNHLTVLHGSNVNTLAKRLRQCLDEAEK